MAQYVKLGLFSMADKFIQLNYWVHFGFEVIQDAAHETFKLLNLGKHTHWCTNQFRVSNVLH